MSTYSDASLILPIAPYIKDGKIYSLKPTDGSGDFTFSRSSEATYIGSDGLVKYASLNEPRYTYLSGSTCPVLLTEPQVTNYCEWSNELSNWDLNSSGTGVDPIITDNYATSPDGTTSASRVQFNAGANGTSFIELEYSSVSGNDYLDSFYVKSLNGSGNLELRIEGEIDRDVPYTSEWNRISADYIESTSTATKKIVIGLDTIFTGETADVLIWGVNIQNTKNNTSHIPSSGAIATRLKDEVKDAGDDNVFNNEEGVLVVEIAAFSNDSTSRKISLNDGTGNSQVTISYGTSSNRITSIVYDGAIQASLDYDLPDITLFNTIALKYKSNDFALYVNKVEVDSSVSGTTSGLTLDNLSLDQGVGGQIFYGKTKKIEYYYTIQSAIDAGVIPN